MENRYLLSILAAGMMLVGSVGRAQENVCQADIVQVLSEHGMKLSDVANPTWRTQRWYDNGPVSGDQFNGQPASCSKRRSSHFGYDRLPHRRHVHRPRLHDRGHSALLVVTPRGGNQSWQSSSIPATADCIDAVEFLQVVAPSCRPQDTHRRGAPPDDPADLTTRCAGFIKPRHLDALVQVELIIFRSRRNSGLYRRCTWRVNLGSLLPARSNSMDN